MDTPTSRPPWAGAIRARRRERALLLKACGYATQVFEFGSLEHARKNKMILAVKAWFAPQGPPNSQRTPIHAERGAAGVTNCSLRRFAGASSAPDASNAFSPSRPPVA